MHLPFLRRNRIGVVYAKTDMMGYMVYIYQDKACIVPKKGEAAPYCASMVEAKDILKKNGVRQSFLALDDTYDEFFGGGQQTEVLEPERMKDMCPLM